MRRTLLHLRNNYWYNERLYNYRGLIEKEGVTYVLLAYSHTQGVEYISSSVKLKKFLRKAEPYTVHS